MTEDRCSLAAVFKIVQAENMSSYYFKSLARTPFYPLFRGMREYKGSKRWEKNDDLIAELLMNYDDRKEVYMFGGVPIQITPMDVRLIMGVTGGEERVPKLVRADLGPGKWFKKTFPNVRTTGTLSQSDVKAVIKRILQKKNGDKDSLAICVNMLAMSTIFFPSGSGRITQWHIKISENLSELTTYDWPSHIAAHVMSGDTILGRGCSVMLVPWMNEHVAFPGRVPEDENAFPRIFKWDISTGVPHFRESVLEQITPEMVMTDALVMTDKEMDVFGMGRISTGHASGSVDMGSERLVQQQRADGGTADELTNVITELESLKKDNAVLRLELDKYNLENRGLREELRQLRGLSQEKGKSCAGRCDHEEGLNVILDAGCANNDQTAVCNDNQCSPPVNDVVGKDDNVNDKCVRAATRGTPNSIIIDQMAHERMDSAVFGNQKKLDAGLRDNTINQDGVTAGNGDACFKERIGFESTEGQKSNSMVDRIKKDTIGTRRKAIGSEFISGNVNKRVRKSKTKNMPINPLFSSRIDDAATANIDDVGVAVNKESDDGEIPERQLSKRVKESIHVDGVLTKDVLLDSAAQKKVQATSMEIDDNSVLFDEDNSLIGGRVLAETDVTLCKKGKTTKSKTGCDKKAYRGDRRKATGSEIISGAPKKAARKGRMEIEQDKLPEQVTVTHIPPGSNKKITGVTDTSAEINESATLMVNDDTVGGGHDDCCVVATDEPRNMVLLKPERVLLEHIIDHQDKDTAVWRLDGTRISAGHCMMMGEQERVKWQFVDFMLQFWNESSDGESCGFLPSRGYHKRKSESFEDYNQRSGMVTERIGGILISKRFLLIPLLSKDGNARIWSALVYDNESETFVHYSNARVKGGNPLITESERHAKEVATTIMNKIWPGATSKRYQTFQAPLHRMGTHWKDSGIYMLICMNDVYRHKSVRGVYRVSTYRALRQTIVNTVLADKHCLPIVSKTRRRVV